MKPGDERELEQLRAALLALRRTFRVPPGEELLKFATRIVDEHARLKSERAQLRYLLGAEHGVILEEAARIVGERNAALSQLEQHAALSPPEPPHPPDALPASPPDTTE